MEFPPDVKIVYIMASITIFSDIKYSISELEICDITLDNVFFIFELDGIEKYAQKLITKHELYVSKLQ